MHLGRTILTVVVALSIAMLPSGRGIAAAVKSADMPHMPAMSGMSSSMDDMDGCPHKKPSSEKAIDDCCASMATCPMTCFGVAGTSSLIVFPSLLGGVPLALAGNPLHAQTGSPPFRPPRV